MEVVKTNLCRYAKALRVRFEEGKGWRSAPVVCNGEAPQVYKEPTQKELQGMAANIEREKALGNRWHYVGHRLG